MPTILNNFDIAHDIGSNSNNHRSKKNSVISLKIEKHEIQNWNIKKYNTWLPLYYAKTACPTVDFLDKSLVSPMFIKFNKNIGLLWLLSC